MPPFLADILKQVRGIWARLDGGQRTTIAAVLLATVAGLGVVVWYSGRSVEQVLFTARDPSELRQAERALSDAGIPFRSDGSRLLVDSDRYVEAGSSLRAVDLDVPDLEREMSALGSVTLDTQSRKAVLERMQTQRLETNLRQMGGVRSARIEASRPPRTLYGALDGKNRPRASVSLEVAATHSFAQVARAAIVRVSSGLGIPEADVRAIDARTGAVIGGDLEDPERALGADDFIARQEQIAEERRQRAQAMLDRVYPGRAFVTVSVELDPRWERRTEKLQPRTPALISEDRVEDGSVVPGPASGDPSDGAALPSSVAQPRGQESRTRVYEPFSGTVETGLLAPEIRSIQVALVIDKSLSANRESISRAVLQAVGKPIDGETEIEVLEDVFAVGEMPGLEATGSAGGSLAEWWLVGRDYAPYAAQVGAVLAALWFLRSLLRRTQARDATAGAGVPDARPLTARAEGEAEDPAAQLRRDIERSIVEDPAAMSRLLESWLAEQKT